MLAQSMSVGLMVQPALSVDAFRARMTSTRDAVTKLAFDTERYFPEERYGRDAVRVVYPGDDFSWPIDAISVRLGCVPGSNRRDCDGAFRVHIVRVPKTPDMRRPRGRAMPMWRRLKDGAAQKPQQVTAIVASSRIQMARSGDPSWVSPRFYSRESRAKPEAIATHADIINVGFGGPGNASDIGRDAPGTPAERATQFAAALNGCWRLAVSPSPRRRP